MSSCEKNKAPCRYMPYQSYINSSAVWYKKKPVHWKCERFKYNFIEKTKINATHLPAGSISFGEVVYKNEKNLSKDTKNSYQEVLAGEYLINPLNLNFDLISLRTALSDIDVVVSTGYIVLQSRGELYSRFARWLLQQFDVSHMKTLGAGVRQTINYADIGNSIFCQPSLEEQITIAAFLDHETAKIDILIDKQQQLIELLKEKRQAVISHAVTKGLNPDVQMKNSGVEWLGEVPEHWVISQIKYLSSFVGTGGTPKNPESFTDLDGIDWFSPGDFNSSLILLDANKKISKLSIRNGDAKIYPKNSIVVIGIGATLGKVALTENFFSCNQQINIIVPNEKINFKYLAYSLSNQVEQMQQASNASTIGIMNQEKTKKIWIVFPKKHEQFEIVKFISKKTTEFDLLLNWSEKQIQFLKERRTALISAAVTGKIDVRDWQVPVTQTESDEVMA